MAKLSELTAALMTAMMATATSDGCFMGRTVTGMIMAPQSAHVLRCVSLPKAADRWFGIRTWSRIRAISVGSSHNSAPLCSMSKTNEPPEYAEVLHMLRQISRNGSWPGTSKRRRMIIKSSDAEVPSDSFTIGLFPPPLRLPHTNELFPSFLQALTRLEGKIAPARTSSTTVTVNRNAQFVPHKDSGAGAGQSKSLIVALGDFEEGELMVEGRKRDIRYMPLEFDGWKELHWTRPFRGERFSLVWYTPKGLENAALMLEEGREWAEVIESVDSLDPVRIFRREKMEILSSPPKLGWIESQRFSMVPLNVNFRSQITRMSIECLGHKLGGSNVLLPRGNATLPVGFQELELCESVRAILLHHDYREDLKGEFSMQELAEWMVRKADWAGGMKAWKEAGNLLPSSERFKGFHVRCKNSFGHLQSGELQELRKEIALAIFRRFGWSPVIKRSDSSLELQIVFNSMGVMLELPLLVQSRLKWEELGQAERSEMLRKVKEKDKKEKQQDLVCRSDVFL